MMRLLSLSAFLLATLAITPQSALAADWYCKLKPQGTRSMIPPDMLIRHNEATGDVVVNDGLIQHYVGSPVSGQLRSENDTRLLFGWSVKGIKNDIGQYAAGITFSINIIKATGAAKVSAKPQGYANSWFGSGTCKRQ